MIVTMYMYKTVNASPACRQSPTHVSISSDFLRGASRSNVAFDVSDPTKLQSTDKGYIYSEDMKHSQAGRGIAQPAGLVGRCESAENI